MQWWTLPWSEAYYYDSIWIVLMGSLVAGSCGLIGNFVILKRFAFVGDAISHTVLPGMVIAFLITTSRGIAPMFVGAIVAGFVTSLLIEFIKNNSRLKPDAAIGITFTTLFAIGVILVSIFAEKVDLDQDCVLYGELAFIGYEPFVALLPGVELPVPIFRMLFVFLATILGIWFFYHPLVISTFDSVFASIVGIKTRFMHYVFMVFVSLVIVFSFESVGAILVVAMLVFPGVTASFYTSNLTVSMYLAVVVAVISSVLGLYIALWTNTSVAASMVIAAFVLFLFSWVLGPNGGIICRAFKTAGSKY